ncbi:DsbC family protein [Thiohalocapsa halophila]|jgi:thiol:disulfide interchange protein DsbC
MMKRFALTGLAALAVTASAAVAADEAATIRAALAEVLPDFKPTSVKATPMEGLYEVEIGPQVMFVTGDGRYLIDGAIIDLESRENIAEQAQARARLRSIEQVGEENMVVFEAPSPEHTITVFTDIDCGYCRKLHEQIQAYNDAGISVRYMFYPRAGADSPAYDKAVSVWCADNRQEAMTRAKAGESMPKRQCANPVAEHRQLGELMGIRGTPAIVLDSGDMVPGYVEPKRLAGLLEQSAAAN